MPPSVVFHYLSGKPRSSMSLVSHTAEPRTHPVISKGVKSSPSTFLIQPRTQFVFFATKTHWWFPFNLLFTRTHHGFFCQAVFQLFGRLPGLHLGFLLPSIGFCTCLCCKPWGSCQATFSGCVATCEKQPSFPCKDFPQSGITWKSAAILHPVL